MMSEYWLFGARCFTSECHLAEYCVMSWDDFKRCSSNGEISINVLGGDESGTYRAEGEYEIGKNVDGTLMRMELTRVQKKKS